MKIDCRLILFSIILLAFLSFGCSSDSSDDSSESPTNTDPDATTDTSTAPIADAGPDMSVSTNSLVTLEGNRSSDPGGESLIYTWLLSSKPGGSSAALSDSSSINPTFTADIAGSYLLNLTVNDGTTDSTEDQVTINALSFIPDTGQNISYTDVFGEDSDYSLNSPSYTDNSNDTVTDNVTGLMWQKSDNGTHNWHEAMGIIDSSNNPLGATDICGNLSLASYEDWRLPTRRELLRLVDFGTSSPAINNNFGGTITATPYWTSDARDTTYAWYVRFDGYSAGYVSHWVQKFQTRYVRCVRGGLSSSQFVDNGDETVSDVSTGLQWQQTDLTNDTHPFSTWDSALAQCETKELAGFSDWRLPNITELESISSTSTLDVQGSLAMYWSSTSIHDNSTDAWVLNFEHDYIVFKSKSEDGFTLCVRTETSKNSYKLPDTGQSVCYESNGTAIDPCPDPGNTQAQDGSYEINTPAFTVNSGGIEGTVTDNNTGLMWQQCTSGLSGSDCSAGIVNTNNWYEATGTADSTSNPGGSINVCGNLSLGGYTDWRLPNEHELMGIVDYNTSDPTINTTVFPNTQTKRYWTGTTNVDDSTRAWYLGFWGGEMSPGIQGTRGEKVNGYYVRCVRGDQNTETKFADHKNGAVTDLKTGLVWQKCPMGFNNDDTCSDDGINNNEWTSWNNALGYCEALSLAGTDDWRLPNIKEMYSIVDSSLTSRTIDSTAFPTTPFYESWSSTTYKYSDSAEIWAFHVRFNVGDVIVNSKAGDTSNVRCVHGGQ